jgi:plasmid stabilization system protein ParE
VREIIFIAQAREEFLAEVAYYNTKEPGLGIRFSIAVEKAVALTITFPQIGSVSGHGTRRIIVKDFPFNIIYKSLPIGLVIFAVAHQSRRPGYWRERISDVS